MSFPRTESALHRDSILSWPPVLVGTLVVGLAWTTWLVFGRLEVTESSDHVRLESGASVHGVDSPAPGRVVAVHARLGEVVDPGAPLLELEADDATGLLQESEQRLQHQEQRLAFARQELAAEEGLSSHDARSAEGTLGEGLARAQEAEAELRLADKELEYATGLRKTGLISDLDFVRRAADAERKRAALDAARSAVSKLRAEVPARAGRAVGRTQHLREEVSSLSEDLAALRTRIPVMRRQVEDRLVRAPIGGRIGHIASLRPGSVVAAGERIADIVPAGGIRAVAGFPLSSIGRLSPGQPARIRLAAYPWTAFGSLSARVKSVGTEPQEGRVRVELEVDEPLPPGVVAAHGLVGSLTVEVDRVSPLRLAFRTAGGLSPSNR